VDRPEARKLERLRVRKNRSSKKVKTESAEGKFIGCKATDI
jgi:hypothetical protein